MTQQVINFMRAYPESTKYCIYVNIGSKGPVLQLKKPIKINQATRNIKKRIKMFSFTFYFHNMKVFIAQFY